MILGNMFHFNHVRKSLANINVKIIYFQSLFNRQVLTSTDSMRLFARIERKKVRIMMSSDILFPSFSPLGFAEFSLKQALF